MSDFLSRSGSSKTCCFERGVEVSHETVRCSWHRFGPMFASEIQKRRIERDAFQLWRWHPDERLVKINGELHYLWRTLDHEGELLESSVTKTRDKKATLRFLRMHCTSTFDQKRSCRTCTSPTAQRSDSSWLMAGRIGATK